MFEHLALHARICVTGSQRSGTTIAGQMIAHDTGHRYVDEYEYGVTDELRWRRALQDEGVVVQCPHMLQVLVDDPPSGIFVVLMRRDLDDIHRSMKRIGWHSAGGNVLELERFGLSEGDSAALKYRYWDEHEKKQPFADVEFEALAGHPLFIGSSERAHFLPKQTTSEAWVGSLPGVPGRGDDAGRRR